MAETTTERKPLIECISDYLANDDWKFDREGEEGNAIQAYVRGDQATFRMRFATDEEGSLLTFMLHGPTHVPDDLRPEVLELLNLMNVRYMIGNFELNVARGEVSFRVGYDLEGGILSDQMIRNMISSAVSAFDKLFPALMAVCFAGVSPAQALVSAEGKTQKKSES